MIQNNLLWSLSLLHRFSAFFPPKTRGRQDSSGQLSCKSCKRWSTLLFCLAQTFRLSSFYISSMGFKSTDCINQDISWRISCSSLLLIYLWQSLLECFQSLSCMSTNVWPTTRDPDPATIECCDSRYDSITLHLEQIPDLAIGKSPNTPLKSLLHVLRWVWFEGVAVLSPTHHHTGDVLFDPKITNFDSSVQRTVCHNSISHSLWTLTHWSLLTLFCFLNSGFFTVILPYRPNPRSLLLTLFQDMGFVMQRCLKKTAFHHTSWWHWWNCSLHR